MNIFLFPILFFFSCIIYGETWETALAGVLTTPPAEGLNGRIYCTAEDRALHALDGISGKEYWNYRPGRKLIEFTLVSPDGAIFVLTTRKDLIAVSPGGWELWRYRLKSLPLLDPAIDNRGIIYLLTDDNILTGIDRRGVATRLFQPEGQFSNLYVCQDKLILRSEGKLDIYKMNGTACGSVLIETEKVVIKNNKLWGQSSRGDWYQLDLSQLEAIPSAAPVPEGLIYPEKGILITDDARIVSGRKDWFMEAYKQGAESYDSYYQPGCNSSRTNGSRNIPETDSRVLGIQQKSLTYVISDTRYLAPLLADMESVATFYEMISRHPDYDIQLMDLVSRSNRVNLHSETVQSELDSHSLYRIYHILARWGDIQTREALIQFCQVEMDPANLRIIYRGLGKIGMDRDGRAISAVYNSLVNHPADEALFQEVLTSALAIARYNGGRSMKIYFDIMDNVSARTRSHKTQDIIRKIMQELL